MARRRVDAGATDRHKIQKRRVVTQDGPSRAVATASAPALRDDDDDDARTNAMRQCGCDARDANDATRARDARRDRRRRRRGRAKGPMGRAFEIARDDRPIGRARAR
jgi:hypothetical protein